MKGMIGENAWSAGGTRVVKVVSALIYCRLNLLLA